MFIYKSSFTSQLNAMTGRKSQNPSRHFWGRKIDKLEPLSVDSIGLKDTDWKALDAGPISTLPLCSRMDPSMAGIKTYTMGPGDQCFGAELAQQAFWHASPVNYNDPRSRLHMMRPDLLKWEELDTKLQIQRWVQNYFKSKCSSEQERKSHTVVSAYHKSACACEHEAVPLLRGPGRWEVKSNAIQSTFCNDQGAPRHCPVW